MKLNVIVLCAASALIVASCTPSRQGNAGKTDFVKTARSIVGTELIGTKGATPEDQDGIDDTVAGICGAKVWTKEECELHQKNTQP